MTSIKIWPGAVVADDCKIEGEVEIGEGTVVHPGASILALAGPVVIGKQNIVEARCVIKNCNPGSVLSIGDGNIFQVGTGANEFFVDSLVFFLLVFDVFVCFPRLSVITSRFIGSNNVIEAKGVVCFVVRCVRRSFCRSLLC